MLILIDGYNVIGPVAPPGRGHRRGWLRAERQLLIDRLLAGLDPRLIDQTCVVFDSAAAPPGVPSHLRIRGLEIRFAVDHHEADDLIEELMASHPAAKRLSVVTSDRRLRVAAKRVGAKAFDAQLWLDSLLDGQTLLAIDWPPPSEPVFRDATGWQSTAHESGSKPIPTAVSVSDWLEHFGLTKEELAEAESQPRSAVPSAPGATPRQGERNDPLAGDSPARSAHQELPDGFNPFPEGYGEDLLE